ncbi:hypothetical protein [Archaeoglobus sulfaticallidus]|nr:hypothetical protein [Archaeoglobus sulfaticallidus]
MDFFTDWEGPWVTTDFALEISEVLGSKAFFERLSQYDDYLYFVERRKGYNAGDTLKLLAPFICVMGLDSKKLKALAENVRFVRDADAAMKILLRKYKPVVISTSYDQFLKTSAGKIGIQDRLHGTRMDVDRLSEYFDDRDREVASSLIEKISKLPEIKVDVENRTVNESATRTIDFLNDLFWGNSDFSKKIRRVMGEVVVIGGRKKLETLLAYEPKERIIAIGDSISDFEMLEWVRKRGLAVSFNGNEYALMNSSLAVISNSAFSEAAVVDAYLANGFDGLKEFLKLFEDKKWDELKDVVDEEIVEGLKCSETEYYLLEGSVGSDDKVDPKIVEKSKRMRKLVRGDAGKLG